MGVERYQRLSAEQWRELIEEQRRSGLSQRAFCRARGLTVSTFYAWKQRLQEAGGARESFETLFTPLAGVSAGEHGAPGWEIELDLGAGVVLRLRRGR